MPYKKRNKSLADSSIADILNSPECVAAHRRIRLYYLERGASGGDEDAQREIEMIEKF